MEPVDIGLCVAAVFGVCLQCAVIWCLPPPGASAEYRRERARRYMLWQWVPVIGMWMAVQELWTYCNRRANLRAEIAAEVTRLGGFRDPSHQLPKDAPPELSTLADASAYLYVMPRDLFPQATVDTTQLYPVEESLVSNRMRLRRLLEPRKHFPILDLRLLRARVPGQWVPQFGVFSPGQGGCALRLQFSPSCPFGRDLQLTGNWCQPVVKVSRMAVRATLTELADVYHNLSRELGEQLPFRYCDWRVSADATLTGWFPGIIPPAARQRIAFHQQSKLFACVLLIARPPVWQLDYRYGLSHPDPPSRTFSNSEETTVLVVGMHENVAWLLDTFEVLPLNQVVV